jgi:hypothetical protein
MLEHHSIGIGGLDMIIVQVVFFILASGFLFGLVRFLLNDTITADQGGSKLGRFSGSALAE